MENSVVPKKEMEANQPANPESDKGHEQPEETGTEHFISIRDKLEERFRTLMDSDASGSGVEENKGHKPFKGQVPVSSRKKTELQKYFQPSVVSIGPLHYDENKFKQSQRFKLQLTKLFIGKKISKKEILSNILNQIESFKECYDQQELLNKFQGNNEDIAWMFFVDGCALIALLLNYLNGDEFFYDVVDEDMPEDQMYQILARDLLLLDNQLPLGVLNLVMGFGDEGRELYQNDDPVGEQSKKFRESLCEFSRIQAIMNFLIWETDVKANSVNFNEANHLLELIWMNLVKKEKASTTKEDVLYFPGVTDLIGIQATRQFRSVKDLQAVGIILEPNNSSSSLRDISFNREIFFCKLKIPRFRVSEQGKFLVFNLLEFEMRPNFEEDRVVASYVGFLNSLLATKEDVAELRKAGILFNYLSNDEEVLKTFQEFTLSLKSYRDVFSRTRKELKNYFNDKKSMRKGKWLSEVRYVYFRSPWAIIAVISATFLLFLTIIQTIFSILAYHHR